MAQVIVTFGAAVPRGQDGAAQVMSAYPRATEEMASSGTSAASTITAGEGDAATVYADGDVWVSFGVAPVAEVESGFFIPSAQTREFGGLKAGHKMAVIDDS